MKKYNLIYAKHTFLMCFVISLIAAIPLFIVSLFYDEVENDILYSLYCLLAGAAVWLLLLAVRESNLIASRQLLFASFGVLLLARLIPCFAKSHQNPSKINLP